MKKIINNKYAQYLLVGLIFGIIPLIPGIPRSLITISGAMVYTAIAGIGFNILLGYSGLISLGHAAFMGISAYATAYLTVNLELPFLLSLVISTCLPALFGLILGLIALRLQGMYLAIATLGFGEIFRVIFMEFSAFTGGFSGARAKHPVIFGYQLDKTETYYFSVLCLTIVLILSYNLINSKIGRSLIAMRSSESAAKAMGINIVKLKLTAFVISTGLAGLAGVLYMHFVRYADPLSFTAILSLDLVALSVIGGLGTIGGPVVGAVILKGAPELLKSIPIIGDFAGVAILFYGILVVVIAMFYERGLIHLPKDIYYKIKKLIKKEAKK